MKHANVRIAIIVAVLIVALVSVFLLQKCTLSSVNKVSEQTALSLLSENANQVREVLDNQLNNIWGRMRMVDSALSAIGDMPPEKAVTYLKNSLPDAYRVELVSEEGAYIDQIGETGHIDLTADILPLFLEDTPCCLLRQQGQQDTLLFGMPVAPVHVGKTEIQYLMAYFKLDSFMELLSVESFAGSGHIRVVDPDGLVLLYTDNLDDDEQSNYLFRLYESARFVESQGIKDFESFKASMLSGENHAIHVVTDSGDECILSYAKVEGIDWFVTIAVTYESVLGDLDSSVRKIGTISIIVTMIVVLVAVGLAVLISADIYKVRTEKQQLGELNQSLERARNIAEDALKIAEDANRSKSYFLSNVSHDIRTPMNAIVGFTELLSREADNASKVREYTGKIKTSSQHLLGLISDVLDMSRIEGGKTTLNLTDESLFNIVDGIITMIRPQISAKGHEFEVYANSIIHDTVVVDKTRLSQICMNLLSNAVKYTPDKGHISFCFYETTMSGNTAHYEIIVSDNGYGMSKEFQKRLFDSFSREEDGRTSKIQGTGLGMAITKNLVELMGGTINVNSKKGEGSTFVVNIPLQISKKKALDIQKNAHTDQNSVNILVDKHILAAEDNELNAELLEAILEAEGATCEICENGKQVLEMFLQSAPGQYDLILMDVQMPVMNGYEATKAIRSSGYAMAREIPIIAMTANAFVEDIQNALNAGMDAHVAKPLDIAVLKRTIQQSIDRQKE